MPRRGLASPRRSSARAAHSRRHQQRILAAGDFARRKAAQTRSGGNQGVRYRGKRRGEVAQARLELDAHHGPTAKRPVRRVSICEIP